MTDYDPKHPQSVWGALRDALEAHEGDEDGNVHCHVEEPRRPVEVGGTVYIPYEHEQDDKYVRTYIPASSLDGDDSMGTDDFRYDP